MATPTTSGQEHALVAAGPAAPGALSEAAFEGPRDPPLPGRAALVASGFDVDHETSEVQGTARHRPEEAPGAAAGAIVTFTGTVRADQTTSGALVTHLVFDAYPEMVTAELERIRREAAARYGLTGITILHRTGRLAVGEPIVLVVAAAAHRAEAFAAAGWTMDAVKARAPLWKRSEAADGTTSWVDGCTCGAHGDRAYHP